MNWYFFMVEAEYSAKHWVAVFEWVYVCKGGDQKGALLKVKAHQLLDAIEISHSNTLLDLVSMCFHLPVSPPAFIHGCQPWTNGIVWLCRSKKLMRVKCLQRMPLEMCLCTEWLAQRRKYNKIVARKVAGKVIIEITEIMSEPRRTQTVDAGP